MILLLKYPAAFLQGDTTTSMVLRSRRRGGRPYGGVYCGGGATKATDRIVFLRLICPWNT